MIWKERLSGQKIKHFFLISGKEKKKKRNEIKNEKKNS